MRNHSSNPCTVVRNSLRSGRPAFSGRQVKSAGLLAVVRGPLGIPPRGEVVGERLVRRAVVWCGFQDAVEPPKTLLDLAVAEADQPRFAARRGVSRSLDYCFDETLQLRQIRLDLAHPFGVPAGLVVPTELLEADSQFAVYLVVVRSQLNRPPQELLGVGPPPLENGEPTAVVERSLSSDRRSSSGASCGIRPAARAARRPWPAWGAALRRREPSRASVGIDPPERVAVRYSSPATATPASPAVVSTISLRDGIDSRPRVRWPVTVHRPIGFSPRSRSSVVQNAARSNPEADAPDRSRLEDLPSGSWASNFLGGGWSTPPPARSGRRARVSGASRLVRVPISRGSGRKVLARDPRAAGARQPSGELRSPAAVASCQRSRAVRSRTRPFRGAVPPRIARWVAEPAA